ncbi:hypothetical protein BpHYR1_035485 [Brachionus plicatilis]|uniref:Uncharacterized protein n=1 Tax=Brachionus plicatilis TaxID=10195 RepID=A0A3M7RQM6_BRAPC|nr:hypothetical protein BpHYR1_035485 [Brachionus plicatilis]
MNSKCATYLEKNLKLKPELETEVGEKLNRLNNKINEIKSRNGFKGNLKLEMAITNLEMFVDTIKKEYTPKKIHQIHKIGH